MNLFALSGLLVAINSFSFGMFSWIKGKRFLNKIWAVFNLSVAVWGMGAYKFAATLDKSEVFFWLRLGHIGVVMMPVLFLHFVFELLETKKDKLLYFIYGVGIFFSILNLTDWLGITKLFIVNLRYVFNSFYVDSPPGLLYPFFVFFFFGAVIYAHYLGVKCFKVSSGSKRMQIKYFLFATAIGFTGGGTAFLMVFNMDVYPFLHFAVAAYPIIMTYAILKHRLMDINIALTRAGIFVFVYLFVLGVPFWLGYKYGLWQYAAWLMLVLATSGPFIYQHLRQQAENKLLAEDLKKYAILDRFAAILPRMKDIDVDRLCKLIVCRIIRTMAISYGAIYMNDEDADACIMKASHNSKDKIGIAVLDKLPNDSALIRFACSYRKEFLIEEAQKMASDVKAIEANYSEVISQMRQLKARLIIPSFSDKGLIGFLVLGEKSSGQPYSSADIEVLVALSHSASLAILNAIFSVKLKDKERELADKSRIIEIGNLASATGHQLGNVLNNIINFGCGILDNDVILEALKDHPKAMADFDKLVKMIITDAQDGDRIIEEIRGYSRQDGNKELSLVSLKEVLDRTLGLLYIRVNKFQNIDININIAPNVPLVLVSPVGMQNVLVNMFNNSYDSIQMLIEHLRNRPEIGLNGYKGKIEVNIGCLNGKVDIRVSDNGKGMTEDVVRRLFTPFYTTKASINKRREIKLSGGTGIGLYTILLLLSDYGGTIKLVRAEPLKGAEFLIQLPLPKG